MPWPARGGPRRRQDRTRRLESGAPWAGGSAAASGLELRALGLGPVDVEELAAGLVGALVGVRAEVVALGLEQVGRQAGGAVAVVVGQRGGEGGHGHAALGGEADDLAPVGLGLLDGLVEVGIEEEVGQLGVLGVGLGDLLQEGRADDAAAAPDRGDRTEVELPAVSGLGVA